MAASLLENPPLPALEELLAEHQPGPDVRRRLFALDNGAQLAAGVVATADVLRVSLVCNARGPLVLQWGLAWRSPSEWLLPPEDARPPGSSLFRQEAVRTPFVERDGRQWLDWEWRQPSGAKWPCGMRFVLHGPDNAWLKSGGGDLYLPLRESNTASRKPSDRLGDLASRIVDAEMAAPSWTLMHRFNLCQELLQEVQEDEEGLTLLFAWLRYSATRHLDWQRRYNTPPRELAHAQDRLTKSLAGLWKRCSAAASSGLGVECRLWVRLMLTTLGPGGDGQKVRDEILQIMHRNNIKEISGRFMEEWHQKLHNNTTPDDVVICEAYLAFLRSGGDLKVFYRTLTEGGVTRERMQTFERPIKTDPSIEDARNAALIADFEKFLGVLRALHSGRDLDGAARAAAKHLNPALAGKLDVLRFPKKDGTGAAVSARAEQEETSAVVSVREELAKSIAPIADATVLRDLLFLDLALEDRLRGGIERRPLSQLGLAQLAGLVGDALRNLALSVRSRELDLCAAHWAMLLTAPRSGRDWALQAKSVADRTAHWVRGFTGDLHLRLQPKAKALGEAFKVDGGVISQFTEEVIRGGPVFAHSLLLRRLDPLLRKEAGLGGWQIISPANAVGRVRVTDRLLAVQGERFPQATVLIADAVVGSEEIPEGVTAVLTSDAPDLVSHVSVRARNAHVLFATCYERETYERLKGLKDKVLTLSVTPGGDVEYSEDVGRQVERQGDKETRRQGDKEKAGTVVVSSSPPVSLSSSWVLTADQFTREVVGGKSCNLNVLRGRLGDWIHLPTSIALPFGAFERVLEDPGNRELRREHDALVAAAETNPAEVLARLRALLLTLTAPADLQASLLETWRKVGLPAVPWDQAWHAVRRVWSSKWNDRAYLSRRARGTPHDRLRMAVLIQQLVEADYAFVIHTANPLTGNRQEIYAEVVLGLGETLVGNYPGRALGFVCRKDGLSLQIVSYPGKSVGLYGTGVIFRSDSDGEDLEGFAGAGLYDSFLATEPEPRLLDYTGEPLIRDAGFRENLLRSIARIGLEVERVHGSPQDVEGAVDGDRFYVVQTRPQVGLE